MRFTMNFDAIVDEIDDPVIGNAVLRMFEDEGRKRGCGAGVLYTISFQAPGFYERNGWHRFGEVQSKPGISRIFMTKTL